jgi:hypothetical protein
MLEHMLAGLLAALILIGIALIAYKLLLLRTK